MVSVVNLGRQVDYTRMMKTELYFNRNTTCMYVLMIDTVWEVPLVNVLTGLKHAEGKRLDSQGMLGV